MKTKNIILSVFALAALVSALIFGKGVLAYRGDYTQKGPNCTPERHEAIEKAFASNDYQAWKDLMKGRGRVVEVINENNFAQFAKAHQLAEEGKYEEADKIRQELGLRTRDGSHVGARYQGRNRQDKGRVN